MALTAALSVAVMAGCTGGSDPVQTVRPTGTLSPTPSATPSEVAALPTAPARPAAMDAAGPAGAAAAASYLMQLYPYVLATGDLAEWDALSADTCDFCANTRAEVQELQAAGLRSVGGISILSAEGTDLGANGWHSASVEIDLAPSEDIDRSGVVHDSNDGGRYTIEMALTWSGAWKVDSAGFSEKPAE